MALTQCAIFYWTSTGILTGKLLADDDGQYARVIPQFGMSMLLASTVPTAKGQGCPDDDTCRQLIAASTKTALLSADADRCAQLDKSGTVVTVLKADPANVTPAQLSLPADHQFVTAHPLAMEGDTFTGGAFFRRYALADRLTGVVSAISVLPLGQTVPVIAGSFVTPTPTAKIGDVLPKPVSAPLI